MENTPSLQATLPEPKPDQAYVEVSALEAGLIRLPMQLFLQGAPPDEINSCPSLAFYIRHVPSGQHLVFDLGLRRDIESFPPIVQAAIARWMPVEVPQSVDESLAKGGIDPKDVKTIVLSHVHFDQCVSSSRPYGRRTLTNAPSNSIGDHAPFPNATFVLGPGSDALLDGGFPGTPASDILEASVPRARTRVLAPADFSAAVGPFPRAHDFFGDSSLFLVEAAGHLAGHVNVLARTSPAGAWILLGGDAAHDVRLLTGECEVASAVDPASGRLLCAHVKKEEAVAHMRRVGSLLGVPGVQVLLAHDWEWYEANKGGSAFLPGKIPPRA